MTIEVEGDVDERAEKRIRRLRDVVSCTSFAPVGDERDKGCAPVEVPDLSGIDAHVSAAALSSFVDEAERSARPLSSVILAQQAEVGDDSAQAILEQMGERLEVMSEAVERGCAEGLRSTSGFTGGDARRMRDAVREGGCATGGLVGNVAYRALAVSELNASMGRIVAAPTAGSCGIIPAVILTLRDELGCSRDACVRGLVTAGGIGMLIQRNATLAGAEGGCQAETGSAAAMAAAAMVELLGGSAQASSDAASMAIPGTAWSRVRPGCRPRRGSLREPQRHGCDGCRHLVPRWPLPASRQRSASMTPSRPCGALAPPCPRLCARRRGRSRRHSLGYEHGT